jgi:hypothetical protein
MLPIGVWKGQSLPWTLSAGKFQLKIELQRDRWSDRALMLSTRLNRAQNAALSEPGCPLPASGIHLSSMMVSPACFGASTCCTGVGAKSAGRRSQCIGTSGDTRQSTPQMHLSFNGPYTCSFATVNIFHDSSQLCCIFLRQV